MIDLSVKGKPFLASCRQCCRTVEVLLFITIDIYHDEENETAEMKLCKQCAEKLSVELLQKISTM